VKYKKYCFAIISYQQAIETINACINKKILPVLFIKYFMINRLGRDWLVEFNNSIKENKIKNKYKLFIDCKKNYGLLIDLLELEVEYLKTEADKNTLKRLNQIARKNKVSLNPNFSIVDLSRIKHINKKITNILAG
tara:strand:+ start:216 stop:623 length:408 start_codon:yes stop_codon:yes gene_type:complete